MKVRKFVHYQLWQGSMGKWQCEQAYKKCKDLALGIKNRNLKGFPNEYATYKVTTWITTGLVCKVETLHRPDTFE